MQHGVWFGLKLEFLEFLMKFVDYRKRGTNNEGSNTNTTLWSKYYIRLENRKIQ